MSICEKQLHSQLVKTRVCLFHLLRFRQRESLGFGSRTVFLCNSRSESLARPVAKFLAGFDIVVHESFGRPEDCGLLTANIPKRYCKIGTFGKPVPGVRGKVEGAAAETSAHLLAGLAANDGDNTESGEVTKLHICFFN